MHNSKYYKSSYHNQYQPIDNCQQRQCYEESSNSETQQYMPPQASHHQRPNHYGIEHYHQKLNYNNRNKIHNPPNLYHTHLSRNTYNEHNKMPKTHHQRQRGYGIKVQPTYQEIPYKQQRELIEAQTQLNIEQIKKRHRRQSINSFTNSRSHEIEGVSDRLQQIQTIMGLQNQNLRQQNSYLMKMIHKMQKTEEKHKAQLRKERELNLQLTNENSKLREKYHQARKFMAQNIHKIQKMMENEQQQNHTSDTSSSFNHPPQLNSIQNYFPDTQPSLQYKIAELELDKKNSKNRNSQNILEHLSDKFDALMFEYQKTKEPALRKECMQIARQIKQQKDKCKVNHNLLFGSN